MRGGFKRHIARYHAVGATFLARQGREWQDPDVELHFKEMINQVNFLKLNFLLGVGRLDLDLGVGGLPCTKNTAALPLSVNGFDSRTISVSEPTFFTANERRLSE